MDFSRKELAKQMKDWSVEDLEKHIAYWSVVYNGELATIKKKTAFVTNCEDPYERRIAEEFIEYCWRNAGTAENHIMAAAGALRLKDSQ